MILETNGWHMEPIKSVPQLFEAIEAAHAEFKVGYGGAASAETGPSYRPSTVSPIVVLTSVA